MSIKNGLIIEGIIPYLASFIVLFYRELLCLFQSNYLYM